MMLYSTTNKTKDNCYEKYQITVRQIWGVTLNLFLN